MLPAKKSIKAKEYKCKMLLKYPNWKSEVSHLQMNPLVDLHY